MIVGSNYHSAVKADFSLWAPFPGEKKRGNDEVYPFAIQNSYGSPDELKKLVKVCHRHGLLIILDVVSDHLGLEGSYQDFHLENAFNLASVKIFSSLDEIGQRS